MYHINKPTTKCCTVKLGYKERLHSEQFGNSEPFPVDNFPVVNNLPLVNNFAMTKKFHVTKLDCIKN